MSRTHVSTFLFVVVMQLTQVGLASADAREQRDSPAPGCGAAAVSGEQACSERAAAPTRSFWIDLDAMIAAEQTLPAAEREPLTRLSFYSFVAALSFELGEQQRLGVRIPWSVGRVRSGAENEQTLSALGNVELAAEYRVFLSETLRSNFAISLIAPTFVGFEHDRQGANHDAAAAASAMLDLQRAVSWSRGLQDGALFEAGRAGAVITASIDYERAGLRVTPFAKLESLVSTRSGMRELWRNTLVLGAEAAYALGAAAELSARAWHAASLSAASESVNAIEPGVSLRLARARVLLGGVIVLAKTESIGLHVVASAGF